MANHIRDSQDAPQRAIGPRQEFFSDLIPKRKGRKSTLEAIIRDNEPVYKKMLLLIQMGSYKEDAACSMGVCYETFNRWFQRGETDKQAKNKTIYSTFFDDVTKAISQGRVRAVMEVRRDNPLAWLRSGPGKLNRPDVPDWDREANMQTNTIEDFADMHALTLTAEDLAGVFQQFESLGLVKRTQMGAAIFGESPDDEVSESEIESDEDRRQETKIIDV